MAGNAALLHYAACASTAARANLNGLHSVAMSLARQQFEAITLVDVACQSPDVAARLHREWKAGRKTVGGLRADLAATVWHGTYGTGLWGEPWSEFMNELGQALHPYAHYTHQAEGWLHAYVPGSVQQTPDGNWTAVTIIGSGSYDARKASRLTLLDAILFFVLARTITAGADQAIDTAIESIDSLARAIAVSEFLFQGQGWAIQFLPDQWDIR